MGRRSTAVPRRDHPRIGWLRSNTARAPDRRAVCSPDVRHAAGPCPPPNTVHSRSGLTSAVLLSSTLFAQQAVAPTPPASSAAEKAPETLAPLPADAHVDQAIQLDGKTLKYTATVGTIPVYEKDGKKTGEVVFTSYIVDGRTAPVTFALNGGPGAASVYLNFGAHRSQAREIRQRRRQPVRSGDAHRQPRHLARFHRPGVHRPDRHRLQPLARVAPRTTKKQFYSTENDIHYLSRIIYDWLVKNGRLSSRKYLVGESYGGYRGPRITHYLQSQLGVAMNGVVLVSPYLNPTLDENADVSPIPWMLTLPSITAAHLEREHKLTPRSDGAGHRLHARRIRDGSAEGPLRSRGHAHVCRSASPK